MECSRWCDRVGTDGYRQIGFLTEWQLYAQKLEGDNWAGEKLDEAKLNKMSGMIVPVETCCGLLIWPFLQINKLDSSSSLCRLSGMKVRVRARARVKVRSNEPYEEATWMVTTAVSRCGHPSILARHLCIYTSATNRKRLTFRDSLPLQLPLCLYPCCKVFMLSRLPLPLQPGNPNLP